MAGHVIEGEVHPGPLLAPVDPGDFPPAAVEERILEGHLIPDDAGLHGADEAVLLEKPHGEIQVGAGELIAGFLLAHAADDAVHAEELGIVHHALFAEHEHIAGQKIELLFEILPLFALAADDLRREGAHGAADFHEFCDDLAALGLAKHAVDVHKAVPSLLIRDHYVINNNSSQ